MSIRVKLFGPVAAVYLMMLFGCTETLGIAGEDAVEECQDTCDQQRFFDCYDANEHAGCYNDCSAASADDIEVFVACVDNTTCDAACSTSIEGRAAEVPEEDRVDTGQQPVPGPTACQSACQAMAADMCIPEDCSPLCADEEVRFQVVYCNTVRNGCDFPAECTGGTTEGGGGGGGGGGGDAACKNGCDQLQLFSCISAGDLATCRNACSTADQATRDTFATCAQSDPGCTQDCYSVLVPEGPSADVSGCQEGCDNLEFFGCLDAQGLSDCRSTCQIADRDAVETFKSCAEGTCDDDSCYQVLLNSI